jgi:poly-gamma-glutamate capsule biosynthesis protein CapA/YwtB (metallophosphatase superfamily)
MGPVRRRALLRAAGPGAGVAAGLAGCSLLEEPPATDPGGVSGRVVDAEGAPVEAASVEGVLPGGEVVSVASAGGDGRFELDARRPVWLRATAEGSVTVIRAGGPDGPNRVRLAAAGTTTLALCGDVMFGRRFYERGDPLRPSHRLDTDDLAAAHRDVLAPVAPLLECADVTAVNLETPLATSDWRHPEKRYTFVGHPTAAAALSWAGVDYAALGNNHTLDALEPGLAHTVEALDDAGVAHSGAGTASAAAWSPAVIDRGGTTVAFVSCTTEVGAGYEVDWSTDRGAGTTHTVERDGETLRFDGGVGVAEATAERVTRAVEEAADRADVVVLQLHAGEEYRRTPTRRVRRLADAAGAAGADVVACHHPHVTGGLERREGTLVAWSLGNLVFDQHLWATLRSYVLLVDVGADGVERARIEPVLIDGYRPHGAVGEPRRSVVWETAGLSDETVTAGDELEYRVDADRDRVERTLGAGSYARRRGAMLKATTGSVRVGRDRLPTGGFDDVLVARRRYGGPLWRFGRTGDATGPDAGREGGGLRLTRAADDEQRALLSPAARLPLHGPDLSLVVAYAFDDADGLELLVSWYDDTSGSSFERERLSLAGTGGDWRRTERSLARPAGATHVDLFGFLSPPTSGRREARFDEFRLVEWGEVGPTDRRASDYLRVEGEATVAFSVPAGGDVEWPRDG